MMSDQVTCTKVADLHPMINRLALSGGTVQRQTTRSSMKRKRPDDAPEGPNEPSKRSRLPGSLGKLQDDGSFDDIEVSCFYRTYAHATTGIIEEHGIERLCDDLGVHPHDVVMLILAWLMDAKDVCSFSYSEWTRGMRKLNCKSLNTLRELLPELELLLKESQTLKSIFRFAFSFSKGSRQRTLDVMVACNLLNAIFSHPYCTWPLLEDFTSYLSKRRSRVVNRDQWNNIFEFAVSIMTDFSNYSDEDAWPVMFDEYVAQKRAQLLQNWDMGVVLDS